MSDGREGSGRSRARGPRARGRGRGRGRGSTPEPDSVVDPLLQQLIDIPPNFNPDILVRNESSGDVERPEVPPPMGKFKPRMVKRVAKAESEDQKPPLDGQNDFGGRGRGRGRGRGADRGGRGRPDIAMTASGSFAMGPAEAGPRTGRFSQGPTRSGMRKVDNSVAPTDARSRTGVSIGENDTGQEEIFELYSDVDSNGSEEAEDKIDVDPDRAKVADLNDITLEHSMAPLSLPWDPKRIHEREKLIEERNLKMANLARIKLKREQMTESKPNTVSSATPSISGLSTPVPATRATTSTGPESIRKSESTEDREDETMKQELKLKREHFEELSGVGKKLLGTATDKPSQSIAHNASIDPAVSVPPFYVFQFPRHFPKFRDLDKFPLENDKPEADPKPVAGTARKVVKKKKPGPDDWMGWGKGGRRLERVGVPDGQNPQDVQGRIGELVIRRSGRVQMIIGNVSYDVLPAAQPTFHQEVAVIDPKPDSRQRAMFVLGTTNQKFIVAPDIAKLLARDQREAQLKAAQTAATKTKA